MPSSVNVCRCTRTVSQVPVQINISSSCRFTFLAGQRSGLTATHITAAISEVPQELRTEFLLVDAHHQGHLDQCQEQKAADKNSLLSGG